LSAERNNERGEVFPTPTLGAIQRNVKTKGRLTVEPDEDAA